MLRSFWQAVKDIIYDNTLGLIRSQEDVDILTENRVLSLGANIVYDHLDIPAESTARKKATFLSIEDAIAYWQNGGIPAGCVTVLVNTNADDLGNTTYSLYIAPNTP